MTDASASRFDPATLLDAIPTPNAAVRAERRGTALLLWLPLGRPWWARLLHALGLPFRERKGFALDALGEEVWSACDGERPLEGIVEDFAARHRVRFHEARAAVLQFLRTMVERKLLTMVVPTTDGGAPAAMAPAAVASTALAGGAR